MVASDESEEAVPPENVDGVPTRARSTVTKKALFYRLAFHWRHGPKRQPPEVDWRARLADASGILSFGDEVTYEAEAATDGAVLLGRQVKSDDFRYRNEGRFHPLGEESAQSYLARVNVAAFFDCNAFVILGAPVGAPANPAVQALAKHLDPRTDGEWVATAITAAPDVERFRVARKVNKVSMKADILPTGLDDTPGSLGAAMEHAASLIGAEISVDLTIRVKRPSQNEAGMRQMKELVTGLLERNHKKLEAYSPDPEVGDTVMNLVTHRLTLSLDIEGSAGPEAALAAIRLVRDERQDDVRQLVARVESEG